MEVGDEIMLEVGLVLGFGHGMGKVEAWTTIPVRSRTLAMEL